MDHIDFMNTAIEIARSTIGQTRPNPSVGCIIVNNGRIVGMGAHLKAGEGHAEIQALKMAGVESKGSTVYVTLEPCSHHGRTPPCADALIHAGVDEVYVASQDPNPLVAGKGVARLKSAGIKVTLGLLEEEALNLNRMFFHYISHKRPFVTLKAATTLDGKIASQTGDSKWITGEAARKDVHAFRHQHDAILVGIGTVLSDDPSLTTRYGQGISPIRIVLDRQLRIPEDAQVLNDQKAETWILTTKQATQITNRTFPSHVQVIEVANPDLPIEDVLSILGDREITSVFVEGGSQVHGSFLESHAFQQVITYIAPKLIGGKKSPTAFGAEGFQTMSEAVDLNIDSVERIGEDIRIISSRRLS
ncbi:bifunctional diaminohydroxyphosphoribosylaminopyrimidine deaminase/5-amino-6-(5-phosphoribosylamino)uracil reductase RibD [Pseudalkalibacillus hwajinpoensis]|uniref:bifunctional diaminohydroxyphosphoribosylaminopyrimidine deaminase/5-amino-6-(5-phosphoribosylamino)uracil reductase RibD n=1 Tax=Guptibacillus hwajinpoensis TaxID=208199 RepID=UPI001CFD8FC8|nr:bifunctional diaminohydroxyphosphoribosylaminopyrimidine deaminase/5-amino-6-(5-phosphoribosylamino)uracil reductase RibD [Pseudalkalibacillus hwajinpoensis]